MTKFGSSIHLFHHLQPGAETGSGRLISQKKGSLWVQSQTLGTKVSTDIASTLKGTQPSPQKLDCFSQGIQWLCYALKALFVHLEVIASQHKVDETILHIC